MTPHHDGSALYVSDPAPALGDTVTVFLRAPMSTTDVHLRFISDGEPRYVAAALDRTVGDENWWRASLVVRNPVVRYRWLLDGARWLNGLGVVEHDVPDAYDFRVVAYDPPPAWLADAVVYQIFPDRFARSGVQRTMPEWAVPCDWGTPVMRTSVQVYGGDLDGIASRLDHLCDLGVDTVYLTPVFPARSNHRYDATAFDAVDPLLGGEAALRRLAGAVRDRGMRLLGDLTTNHCGAAHPWFRSALDGGPERELFYFDEEGGYESWLGVASLPKLNWGSAELRRRILEVAVRWLDVFDGWRIDVANMTGRRGGDDRAHEVAALLRSAVVTAREDAAVLAELCHDFTGDLDRDGWQGTMNYAGFTRPVWNWLRAPDLDLPDPFRAPGALPSRGGTAAVAAMRAFNGLVSWRAYTHSWNLLGSHDTARIATVVGDEDRHEVAVGLLATLPGVPMIFAGDELGLTAESGEAARTPMPWGRKTLPLYRDLIALRRSHPALRGGGLRWVHVDDDTLAFLREDRDESLLVVATRAHGRPPALVPAGAEPVYGGALFQVWSLPPLP